MATANTQAYMAALRKKYAAMLADKTPAPTPEPKMQPWGDTLTPETKPSLLESAGSPTNPVGAAIDVLSRFAYGSGRFMRETQENMGNVRRNLEQGKPLQAAGGLVGSNIDASLQGLREIVAPENRELPSESLLENWEVREDAPFLEKSDRFLAGLLLDIGLDPLTYVGAGAIRGAAKAIPGVASLGKKITQGTRPLPKRPMPEKVVENAAEETSTVASNAENAAITSELVAPEVPQIAGPRQIEAPPPKPSVLLLEAGPLGKKAQAVKAAQEAEKRAANAARTLDKVSDGSYVFKAGPEGLERTPTEGLVWAASKTGEISQEPARYRFLENIITGEKKPYRKGLLNLTRSQPKYQGVTPDDIPDIFTYPRFEVSEEAITEQLFKQGARVNRNGEPYTLEQWTKYAASKNLLVPYQGRKVLFSNLPTSVAKTYYAKYLEQIERARVVAREHIEAARIPSSDLARADRAADRAKPVRLEGSALAAVHEKIKTVFDAQDAKEILSKKSPETYKAAVEAALKQKVRTPTFIERVVESGAPRPYSSQLADELFNAPDASVAVGATPKTKAGSQTKAVLDNASQGIKPAAETIAEAVPGASRGPESIAAAGAAQMDDYSALALMYALGPDGQQWAQKAGGFNWETLRMHSARNSPTPGEGLAVNREAFNTMAQTNAWRVISLAASREAAQQGLSGLARSAWIASPEGFNIIGRIRAYEQFLRLNGAEPIVTKGKQGWPLGLGDVLDVLYNEGGRTGRNFVDRRILSTYGISARGQKGVRGAIEPTALLEAVRVILDSIDPKWNKLDDLQGTVKSFLGQAVKGNPKYTEDVYKALMGDEGIKYFTQKTGQVNVKPEDAKAVLEEAFTAIFNERTIHGLLQRAHDNAAHSTIQIVDTVRQLSQETMTNIVNVLHNRMASIGDTVGVLSKVDEGVNNAAVKNPMHVSEDAAKIAVQNVKDELPTFVRQADIHSADHIRKATNAAQQGNREAVIASNATRHKQAVAEAMEEVPVEQLNDPLHMADVAMQAGLFTKMAPFKSKLNEFFLAHYGNATIHDAITRGESILRNLQSAWRQELNFVNRLVRNGKASSDDIVVAMRYLQGRTPVLTPAQREVVARLQPAVENIFETGRGRAPGIFGAFFREGYDPVHLANKMASHRYGLKEAYRLDLTAATKNGKVDIEALANQWKSWEIDDPLDFMARMQTLAGSLQLDMATANEAWRIANSLGYASRTQRKGFIKMPHQDESIIGKYMPKDAWFAPEILREIQRMDEILTSAENFTTPFGQFVNRYLDPILNTWKSGMTVWNPGHHIRNFVGDSSLSFLADGVKNPKYYADAVRVQKWRDHYTTQDALDAMRGRVRVPEPGGDVVVKMRNGVKLTEREVFYGMMNRGALPSAAVSEDLLESMSSPTIAAVQQKMAIFGGRGKAVVNRVSEGRDDTVRLAHAMHILEHGNFKNVSEALDAAAKQVRRWHPDGLSLSPQERKIMRRIFPFYSWTRKTIPLVVESMVLHPGRVLIYPKASYNLAQANGLDPNSMSDPFPEDQLFPSYLTSQVFGPQWRDEQGDYHQINPGFPTVDVLADFVPDPGNAQNGSDILRELFTGPINMLSPMVKGPVEALTGTNLGTGGEIHSLAEYLDSQVPGVNKVSSITGASPIGTTVNALPGGNAGIDWRRAVEKGNRDPGFSIEALINYLTGASSMDMSQPSSVNMAEIELRNRTGRQRDEELRRLG